jgi:hypothetical protein
MCCAFRSDDDLTLANSLDNEIAACTAPLGPLTRTATMSRSPNRLTQPNHDTGYLCLRRRRTRMWDRVKRAHKSGSCDNAAWSDLSRATMRLAALDTSTPMDRPSAMS